MNSNYSLAEIQNLVAKGAVIYEDGTIQMPPETYSVMYEFVSGTAGKLLPEEVKNELPLNQANVEDGIDFIPSEVSETVIEVEDGTWVFQGWDKDKKVVSGENLLFVGTWVFDAKPESGTEPESEPETELNTEPESSSASEEVTSSENNSDETIAESETQEETTQPDEENKSNGGLIAVAAAVIAAGIGGGIAARKKSKKKEEQK